MNFRVPGPTPLPPEVLKAVSRQMINHRGHAYEEMHGRIVNNLKHFFQTTNEIYLLTASGTGGFDASIVNFFSPSETLVFFTSGVFGDRWADTARAYGARVVQMQFDYGKAVETEQVKRELKKYKNIAGVFFTHNETSTGVLNSISDLVPLVKNHPSKPIVLVDSISALGAVDLPMDELGIDVLLTASQKAWMSPPGICMIAVSEKAWRRYESATMPKYYFDLKLAKEFAEKYQTPATPAVSAMYGLDAALTLMQKEGREHIYTRHIALRDFFRAGIQDFGLELFVANEVASPTVTSVLLPKNVEASKLLTVLKEKYNTVLAGGMGPMKGKIIRIAHMGYCSQKDMEMTLNALKKALSSFRGTHP